jgi:dTDP-4-amino-4,6-dideoxygalactose transaminase
MKVPYVNLGLQHEPDRAELLEKVGELLDSGMFILGNEVSEFERSFAKIAGTKYAVGVANGTDSLMLSMQALGICVGDEVITVSHSYLSSASSIALVGANPVLIDVDSNFNMDATKLEAAITPKTKAIIVVHLTGRPADMDPIIAIANRHKLPIIEDAAQAVGARYKGKPVGGFGTFGSFSLHPLKNLAAAGDAGVITTDNENYYKWLLKARNHGLKNRDELEFFSVNSRLDALQAAILNIKLRRLDEWNVRRREIADRYISELEGLVTVPSYTEDYEPVFHAFVIQTDYRDALADFLSKNDIDSKVHYPIAIHQQKGAKSAIFNDLSNTEIIVKKILSLPVYPELTDEQVSHVIKTIKLFFHEHQ